MGYVGNVVSDGETNLVASTLYGSCSTAAATAAKIVECANYDALIAGTTIHVKFIYSNTADEPTLNVNGTGAIPIYTDGVNYPGKTVLTSWQQNSVVSLTYDGTAWRMNDVGAPASNHMSALLNMVYPVGAIYMSVSSTSPATLFGGGWEQLKDTFLLAAGTAHAAASTGGAETHSIAVANLPSHSHEVGAHSHTMAHTHTGPSHSHGLNGHTHTIPALSGTAASNGAHTHASGTHWVVWDTGSSSYRTGVPIGTYSTPLVSSAMNPLTNSAGAHTHSVSTTASTTGGNSGSTAAAGTGNTGGSSAANTGTCAKFNTGSTGSGQALDTMPPYLAVYVWKRVS